MNKTTRKWQHHNTHQPVSVDLSREMIIGQNKNKDRQIVEDYIRLYCLEEILDEIMSHIISKLPATPYNEISNFLLKRTLPEIFQVKISSRIIGSNSLGIYVEILSNYGTFTGLTGSFFDTDNNLPVIKDYSLIQQRMEELLCPLDPQDFQTIDQMLKGLTADIDPPIILATSIACLRMASRFHDLDVYSFISTLSGCEPTLPLPIATVLSRQIGLPEHHQYQYFHLYPLYSSNLLSALETLTEFTHRLQRIVTGKQFYDTPEKLEKMPSTNIPSLETLESITHPIEVSSLWNGSISVCGISLSRCLRLITTAIEEDGDILAVKPSIDCRGSSFVRITHNSTNPERSIMNSTYLLESSSTPSSMSSVETAETLLMLWKEYEMISLEDIFHPRDRLAYQHFKMRVDETIAALLRDEAVRELAYAQKGVGMDETCHLQLVFDQLCQTTDDLIQLQREYSSSPSPSGGIIQTIKVRLEKFSTISQAITFCKLIHEMKWNIQISCSEESPETSDSFLADFAVGVGAYQFLGGGIYATEYSCKYNRLIEIQQQQERGGGGGGKRIPFVGSKFRKKY